ncbi:hypothetical protein [Aureispira anguillae]|uniref:Uncharacterized protein n=1 Tax=Aureispira anguillae TaxID=2864201 RepID=A0A915YLP5_9BACT|nr:hypothetical protein [Aureispira anguillae]BDS15523.1 hypothetical protein AsAng_0063070 [Aureispira anguillae]
MFSIFNKKQKKNHLLFGELVYRKNRGANKKQLPGFWEGLLQLEEKQPTQLILWGDKKATPHPKQEALFNRIVNKMDYYIQLSKEGLYQHIREEEAQIGHTDDALPIDLDGPDVTWTLEQLYFQAYPMSERLQEDLETDLDGVAWGFRFKVSGFYNGGGAITAYSAFVNLNLHPKFPFTYQ